MSSRRLKKHKRRPKKVKQTTPAHASAIARAANTGDASQLQMEKENVLAIDAAENEGLPVVGVGDEKPGQVEKAEIIPIRPPKTNASAPLLNATDTSEEELKRA